MNDCATYFYAVQNEKEYCRIINKSIIFSEIFFVFPVKRSKKRPYYDSAFYAQISAPTYLYCLDHGCLADGGHQTQQHGAAPLPAALGQAEVPHGRRYDEHHHHDQQPGAQRPGHGTVELKSV